MPISVGIAGYEMTQPQRIAVLVAAVGGPVKAAALLGKSRTHIDNMRKEGAALRLEDLLPLCREAGVSLDWVATGYQQRPDLAIDGPGLVAIPPLQPTSPGAPLAFETDWLEHLGVPPHDLRRAAVEDDGMAPLVNKGDTVLVDMRPAPPRSGVYLLDVGDELLARRVIKRPGGKTELVADRDARWTYDLTSIEDLTLYRIVWSGHVL